MINIVYDTHYTNCIKQIINYYNTSNTNLQYCVVKVEPRKGFQVNGQQFTIINCLNYLLNVQSIIVSYLQIFRNVQGCLLITSGHLLKFSLSLSTPVPSTLT